MRTHLTHKCAAALTATLIFLITSLNLNSQEAVEIQFRLTPGTGLLKVDGQILEFEGIGQVTKKLKLTPGTYTVEMWAPYYLKTSETIEIAPEDEGRVIKFAITQKSENLVQYLEAQKNYKNQYNWRAAKIATIGVAAGGLTAFSFSLLKAKNENIASLEDLQENYPNLLYESQKEDYRNERQDLIDRIEKQETYLYAFALPLTAIAYIGGGLVIHKMIKNPLVKPSDPEPGTNPFASELGSSYIEYKLNIAPNGIGLAFTF